MIDPQEIERLNRKISLVSENLINNIGKMPDSITKKLAIGANDIRNTIIKSMRNTKKSSKTSIGTNHFPSLPEHPPAIDTGELLRSIMFDIRKFEIEVGVVAGAPYGKFLEFGTKKMKERPFLEPAIEKHKDKIFKSVGDDIFEIIKESFEKI